MSRQWSLSGKSAKSVRSQKQRDCWSTWTEVFELGEPICRQLKCAIFAMWLRLPSVEAFDGRRTRLKFMNLRSVGVSGISKTKSGLRYSFVIMGCPSDPCRPEIPCPRAPER
jgi:hypothetical protein